MTPVYFLVDSRLDITLLFGLKYPSPRLSGGSGCCPSWVDPASPVHISLVQSKHLYGGVTCAEMSYSRSICYRISIIQRRRPFPKTQEDPFGAGNVSLSSQKTPLLILRARRRCPWCPSCFSHPTASRPCCHEQRQEVFVLYFFVPSSSAWLFVTCRYDEINLVRELFLWNQPLQKKNSSRLYRPDDANSSSVTRFLFWSMFFRLRLIFRDLSL